MGAGVVCAEGEMSGDAAAGFGGYQVSSIGVDLEQHVVGNKPEVALRISCSKVEEAIAGSQHVDRWRCLLCGDGI